MGIANAFPFVFNVIMMKMTGQYIKVTLFIRNSPLNSTWYIRSVCRVDKCYFLGPEN